MTYATPNNNRNWRRGKGSDDRKKAMRGFGLVEKMFYYYKRIKKEIADIKAEQSYYQCSGKTGGGSSNHAFISDTTAQLAIKHMNKIPKIFINADKFDAEVISRPEDWLVVIEQTFHYFSDYNILVGEVLRRRFIENEPMATTCIDLEIATEKYYRLRDEGVTYARECAIQLGLIRVFDLHEQHDTEFRQ